MAAKAASPKTNPAKGIDLRESAEIVENECAGAAAHFASDSEEKGDRNVRART